MMRASLEAILLCTKQLLDFWQVFHIAHDPAWVIAATEVAAQLMQHLKSGATPQEA